MCNEICPHSTQATSDWMTLLLLKAESRRTESASAVIIACVLHTVMSGDGSGGVTLNRLFHTPHVWSVRVCCIKTQNTWGEGNGQDNSVSKETTKVCSTPSTRPSSPSYRVYFRHGMSAFTRWRKKYEFCNNEWWNLQAKVQNYTTWNAFLFINRCFFLFHKLNGIFLFRGQGWAGVYGCGHKRLWQLTLVSWSVVEVK